MLLRIRLPTENVEKWPAITLSRAKEGRISPNDLERLIGNLSFTQTSVFGRFRRTVLKPLYDKPDEKPYSEILTKRQIPILLRRVRSLGESVTRTVEITHKTLKFGIYTDAATSARIVSALICDNRSPNESLTVEELRADVSIPEWANTRRVMAYICCLEMLAIAGGTLYLGEALRNATVTFYIDNSTRRDALVMGGIPIPYQWAFSSRFSGPIFRSWGFTPGSS